MVRRSETFGTLGRVTAAQAAKEEARIAAHSVITISSVEADDDFPELNR